MKQVNDFRIFNKIVRKYYKRHTLRKVYTINGKPFVSHWEISDWVGFRIENVEQLTPKVRTAIRWMVGPEVMNALKNIDEYLVVHPNVLFDHEKITKVFKGFMLTNRDAYAIVRENEERNTEELYPLYFLVNAKTNLHQSC